MRACIQYRMLNRGKGPAVHSLRAQADRRKYQQVMKHTLEMQERLTVRQGEIVDLRAEGGRVRQVVLRTGAVYRGPGGHPLHRNLSAGAHHCGRVH